jgi:NCAIR mutase (PurE)-related protein
VKKMDKEKIQQILQQVQDGSCSVQQAMLQLKMEPFEDLGFAKLDHHRALRQGAAEVIYGAGKTAEQMIKIAAAMQKAGQQNVLITRLSAEKAVEMQKNLPLQYDKTSRIGFLGQISQPDGNGTVVVATGGTSDMPVAEEAALTAEILGNQVTRLYDVGVAGLHRLLAHLDEIMSANVIVAVAGMEGALASVIGGLADCPVIAVPTSVGYGASLGAFHAQFLCQRRQRCQY